MIEQGSVANYKAAKHYRKDFRRHFSKSLVTISSLVGGILALLQFTNVITYNLSVFAIIFLVLIIISLLYSTLITFGNLDNEPVIIDIQSVTGIENPNLTDELITTVKKLHGNNNHIDVIRLCSNLSRPLWISGKYSQRITIGAFYEDSASRINSYNEQVCALIDDLGWTNAVVGNISVATDNINQGIKIAENNLNYYMAAKGNRHLGVIELRYKGNYLSAITYFEKAESLSLLIKSSDKRNEMIAGITNNLSQAYLLNNEIEKTIEYAYKSKELFTLIEDDIRLIKVENQIARILISKGSKENLNEAKSILNEALAKARKLARIDQVGKCLISLSEIHIKHGQKELAINTLAEAKIIFRELNAANEINRTDELLLEVNNQRVAIR